MRATKHVNTGKYSFEGYGDDHTRSKYWKPKDQNFTDLKFRKKINKTSIELKTSFFNEELIDLITQNGYCTFLLDTIIVE